MKKKKVGIILCLILLIYFIGGIVYNIIGNKSDTNNKNSNVNNSVQIKGFEYLCDEDDTELFKTEFKKLKKNGKSILNYDDEYNKYFITDNTIYYGFNGGDYHVIDYKMTNKSVFTYIHDNKEYKVTSPLIGKYDIYNLLLAIVV